MNDSTEERFYLVDMENDIDLMLQVRDGNLAAFEKLFLRYRGPIANFFFRVGCDYGVSEDYVQEVFFRIWKARKNYSPKAKFTTFLFQIAKNYWLNELGKKKRRPAIRQLSNLPCKEQIAAGDISPEKKILAAELQEKIQEAIDGLPEKYRLVFVLSEISELKYKEIAEVLEIPVGTVKSRMFVAERKLRKKIERYLCI